jgi:hypothetical protein
MISDVKAFTAVVDLGGRAIEVMVAHSHRDSDRLNTALSYVDNRYGTRATFAIMAMLAKASIPAYGEIADTHVVRMDPDGVTREKIEDLPPTVARFMAFVRAVNDGDMVGAEAIWLEVFGDIADAEPDEDGTTYANQAQIAFLSALLRAASDDSLDDLVVDMNE